MFYAVHAYLAANFYFGLACAPCQAVFKTCGVHTFAASCLALKPPSIAARVTTGWPVAFTKNGSPIRLSASICAPLFLRAVRCEISSFVKKIGVLIFYSKNRSAPLLNAQRLPSDQPRARHIGTGFQRFLDGFLIRRGRRRFGLAHELRWNLPHVLDLDGGRVGANRNVEIRTVHLLKPCVLHVVE